MSFEATSRRQFHRLAFSALAGATAGASLPGSRREQVGQDPIEAACKRKDRLPVDTERDGTRHPQRILEFFQVKPGQQVADILAGDGYYTELASRIVGEQGKVYCINNAAPQRVFGKQLTTRLGRKEFDTSNVARIDRELTDMQLPAGKIDRALLVRFYHDFGWMEVDRAKFNKAVFTALKPGGIYAVVDHHAKEGAGMSEGQRLHRVEARLVRKEIEQAGFKLEAESYLLNDPTDKRDFNIFENQAARRDRTDRFVYLFRKPSAE